MIPEPYIDNDNEIKTISSEICKFIKINKINFNNYKKMNIYIKNNCINNKKTKNKSNDKKEIYQIEQIINCGIRFYNYINNYIFSFKNVHLYKNEYVDIYCDYSYIKFVFPNKSIIDNIGNYQNAKDITTLYKTNECVICYEDIDLIDSNEEKVCNDEEQIYEDTSSILKVETNKKNNINIRKNKSILSIIKNIVKKKFKNKQKLLREIKYFKCGHGFCNKCCEKLFECPLCKKETEKDEYIIYISISELIEYIKENDYNKYIKMETLY
jgi:hypothetical protein